MKINVRDFKSSHTMGDLFEKLGYHKVKSPLVFNNNVGYFFGVDGNDYIVTAQLTNSLHEGEPGTLMSDELPSIDIYRVQLKDIGTREADKTIRDIVTAYAFDFSKNVLFVFVGDSKCPRVEIVYGYKLFGVDRVRLLKLHINMDEPIPYYVEDAINNMNIKDRGLIDENGLNTGLWHAIMQEEVFYLDESKAHKSFIDAIEALKSSILLNNSGININYVIHVSNLILQRMLFLQFIQSKGWLEGDTKYLKNRLEYCKANKLNYFKDELIPLFFDILNTPIDKRTINKNIPFLNGGLFSQTEIEERINVRNLNIPNDAFDKVFSLVFDKYTFIPREDRGFDRDFAIDPEFIGKLFEASLTEKEEGNTTKAKKHGVVYTPREVVAYMCKESLKQWLKESTPIEMEKIEWLVFNEYYKSEDREFTRDELTYILNKLNSIKVCDPAVGSGALLVGMLMVLVDVKARVLQLLGEEVDYYKLKYEIIKNSLYGVDIDKDALEIAKLRLWLSLVVDFNKDVTDIRDIPALPNLDYKLRIGNSLISKINDVELDTYIINNMNDNMISFEIRKLATEKFKEIYKLEEEYYSETDKARKDEIKALIKEEMDKLMKDIGELLSNGKTTLTYEDISGINGFSWTLSFTEVFYNLRGKEGFNSGFDIVIGNPPYVRHERIKEFKDRFKERYKEVFHSSADLYVYFYKLGLDILNRNGILGYITSNKWMKTQYGKPLRQYLKDKTFIKTFIDFGSVRVFRNAGVYTNILIVGKDKWHNDSEFIGLKAEEEIKDLYKYIGKNGFKFKQNNLSVDTYEIVNDTKRKLKEKIESKGVKLKDWEGLKIFRGFTIGCNQAFIIDQETKEKLCKEDPNSIQVLKPILRGRDISRYSHDWAGLWLINIPCGWTDKNRGTIDQEKYFQMTYPAIYNHLRSIGDAIEEGIIKVKGKGVYNRDDQGKHWWELRAMDEDQYNDICGPKIMWQKLSKGSFSIDCRGEFLVADSVYIMNSQDKYLLAILNSNTIKHYMMGLAATLGESNLAWSKHYMEQLPIPQISEEQKQPFIDLVDRILDLKGNPNREQLQKTYEEQIDELVYRLYDLTDEEIRIIESAVK